MGFGNSNKSDGMVAEPNGVKNYGFIDDEVKFPKLEGEKNGGIDSENLDKDKKEEEEQKDKSSIFALFKYSRTSDKVLYFIGIIAAMVTGLTTPANSYIFGDLSDSMVTYGKQVVIDPATADHQLFLDAVQKFALYNTIIGVVMLACTYLAVTCFNYAAQSQIFIIRNKFFLSVLHQDISWYDKNQSGEFASRMNEDLSKMEEGLGEKVVMFITFMTAFVGAIVLAFVKGWLLALVCLSSLPVTMISMGLVSVVTSRLSKQELDVYAKAGNIAEEAFTAIRTVKAFEGQDLESEKYESQLVHARKLNTKRGFFSGLGFGLLWFFIYASYALAFWYGVKLILNEDETTYTPGTMITVFFSVMMGSMNIGMASPYIEAFGIAKGASIKVFKLIEQIPTINPLNFGGKVTNEEFKAIEFKNIHFSYPTRKEVKVLNGINIKIQKGETVALVGSSGCGKSTCIQLLQRFYDPDAGQILFNGDDLKELNVEWVRSKIGTVGQEPVLFGTTIAENIRYGREDATIGEIEEAAKQAYAHSFIKKLPLGYNTLVGERGAQLSGGQKQRIAIARALIRRPEILLLDEATSALDTASEAKVQAVLEKASQGRTTIIVAHRLSTIRRADKIIVLNKGNVVESGTHDELMELRQEYYNLVTTQLGDLDDLKSPNSATQDKKPFEYKDRTNDDTDSILEEDEDVIQTEIKTDEEQDVGNVSLTRIIELNTPEWPHILTGCLTSIIMGCAFPLFAVIFGDILGALSGEDPDTVRSLANKYSMYFAITGVVVGAATFLTIYSFTVAGEKLTERLRGMAFRAMLRQELGWFDDKTNGTGSLCARLSGDASAVQGATGQRIGTIVQSLTTLILGVGLSMYYQWKLGLVALAFTPFILVATYLQRKVMAEENMGTTKSMENCTKLAVEVVSNVRTVVSLGREQMFHTQYVELLEPSVKLAKRNTHFRGVVYGLARSIMFFAYATCMYYGGQLVVNTGLFYGDVFKVSQALIMGTMSIANALAFAPNFQKGVQAAKYMFTLFNRKPKIQDPSPYQTTQNESWKCNGNVTFQEVDFFYPTRPSVQVLQELNMNVYEGQTVALVGPSGCGKSTCIQLLQRFYDPYNGIVAVDDSDLKSVTQKTLRKQLGIVSQEPALFDRTIAENIAYGDNSREVGQDEIIEAAKKANIHNFITSLPLGYETRLGERGTQLSGGQKQRVAIARALLRNPKILLLDEATSALDAESEKVVQEALETAMVGRTSITIAHRLSTIVDSDVILVFDAGKIVEKGTHKELLALRGVYYNLYKLQVGTN